MVCACSTMAKLQTQVVQTQKIDNFLGMTSKETFWPQPTVTDSGVQSNANWASIAATAVALVNTVTAVNIANKQYKIAKDYYNLARQKWDRFRSVYMPCERKEMAEACQTPEYTPQYYDKGNAYLNAARYEFGGARTVIDDLYDRYCVCPDPTLAQDLAMMQSAAEGDGKNFAYREEEARKEAKDDKRWNRRAQALNRGRDLQSQAISYAKAAAGAYGDLGKTIGGAAEGAVTALGYFSTRRDTVYPQRTPLQYPGGAAVGDGFMGAQNGVNGWISPTPSPIESVMSTNIQGYQNINTTYNSNSAIGSAVGSQQGQTSGG